MFQAFGKLGNAGCGRNASREPNEELPTNSAEGSQKCSSPSHKTKELMIMVLLLPALLPALQAAPTTKRDADKEWINSCKGIWQNVAGMNETRLMINSQLYNDTKVQYVNLKVILRKTNFSQHIKSANYTKYPALFKPIKMNKKKMSFLQNQHLNGQIYVAAFQKLDDGTKQVSDLLGNSRSMLCDTEIALNKTSLLKGKRPHIPAIDMENKLFNIIEAPSDKVVHDRHVVLAIRKYRTFLKSVCQHWCRALKRLGQNVDCKEWRSKHRKGKKSSN